METTKKELQEQLNKIQKQLDNFKEEVKFKKGDWVKNTLASWMSEHPTSIYRVRKISGDYLYVEKDYWNNYIDSNCYSKNFIPATDKEVVEASIKEAKERGFKNGVEYKGLGGRHNNTYTLRKFDDFKGFMENYGYMCNGYGDIIFENGEWAEIIENKVPEIGNYKMKIKDGDIRFGCMTFNFYEVKELLKSMNTFSINCINIEGYDIRSKTIEEIINYYNSKTS